MVFQRAVCFTELGPGTLRASCKNRLEMFLRAVNLTSVLKRQLKVCNIEDFYKLHNLNRYVIVQISHENCDNTRKRRSFFN